jgi:hypothetical protein
VAVRPALGARALTAHERVVRRHGAVRPDADAIRPLGGEIIEQAAGGGLAGVITAVSYTPPS